MEQRIGPSSQPLEGAGFDPAFIPGLTAPAIAEQEEPEDKVPAQAAAPEEPTVAEAAAKADRESDGEAPADESRDETPDETPEAGPDPDSDSAPDSDSDSNPDSDSDPDSDSGPVFEASDRRARIVADHEGVRLSLDDESCEFRWDEIGAVETESPRFGRRFTITVHTPDRRWYPIEIEATARSRFSEWETQLDEVLDAYFEE